ncbi:unnamed protein product [Thelazia callipaeda]|uniref:Uncharacterized protein n=1 Tax=Thelazia callipaeda TaxID=103827 RepID=A0A0N5CLF5_THECL|nr:unnamed protein product [Thelazia callipaeda]
MMPERSTLSYSYSSEQRSVDMEMINCIFNAFEILPEMMRNAGAIGSSRRIVSCRVTMRNARCYRNNEGKKRGVEKRERE